MSDQFRIEWLDAGREPRARPDPAFPDGVDIDTGERPACKAVLPYPARRCGAYVVTCQRCGSNAGVTTAGRRDDPCSVMMVCRLPRA